MTEIDQDQASPVTRARDAFALLREATITIALIALVLLFIFKPAKIGGMLHAAGIHSVDVAGLNVETELRQASEQLEKTRGALDQTQARLSANMQAVDTAGKSIERVLNDNKLDPSVRAQLSGLPKTLSVSKSNLVASQKQVSTARMFLDNSAQAQRRALMQIRPEAK